MKLIDYIQGSRHGREAHDLELEAMRDPLMSDALDGFDAVPGDHTATLEQLSEKILGSAKGGRASARARQAHLRERRIRGWSVAAAAVFIAGAISGGVWLLGNEVSHDAIRPALASKTGTYGSHEVEAILPPVTVIKDDAEPVAEATDISTVRLDRDEVPALSGGIAAESAAQEQTNTAIPAADTTQTAEFRRYVYARNIVRSAVLGPVTLSFEVGADGRPRNIKVIEEPADFPGAARSAVELLNQGPDWPSEPSRKLITVNL